MTTTSLIKTALRNSIAETIYKDITTKTSKYYYFLGKVLEWNNSVTPDPVDNFNYELDTRSSIVTMKQITPSDISFVVKRYDWIDGVVYDRYDDRYGTELIGINLTFGGENYTSAPDVIISGGNGFGATAVSSVLDGKVIDITVTNPGNGYTTAPTITLLGGDGTGASAEAVINLTQTGSTRLEEAVYYVMTNEFNVYKCLENNNGAVSTKQPIGTSPDPIRFSEDGYVWKFLFNVPPALRNKFVTPEYFPVLSALRSQFYSQGDLRVININSRGTGYDYASIRVLGDGYRSSNPLLISEITIDKQGSGYTSATVNVEEPFSGSSPYLLGSSVISGQYIDYENNYYQVIKAGNLGPNPPIHLDGIVDNGSSSLKYSGTLATADAEITDGKVTSIIKYYSIDYVYVNSGGGGYTSAPNITFIGGDGSGASAVAEMQNGSVKSIKITNPGKSYTSVPNIIIGESWSPNNSVTTGDQIFYADRLYTVTTSGTTSITPPIHISGDALNGTCSLQYAGRAATGTCELKFGSGYSFTPDITISTPVESIPWNPVEIISIPVNLSYNDNYYQVTTVGVTGIVPPTHTFGTQTNGTCELEYIGSAAKATASTVKSEARLVPIINNGEIVSVQIDDAGIGYTNANIIVYGNGSGVDLSADLSVGNITTLQANIELLTVDGSISSIEVVSGGYDYSSASVDIIGDGEGALANAVIENGKIVKINLLSGGQNYHFAQVVITGNGNGANARSIISPYGGHGRDAITELNARALMFYTNISGDTNQGFVVNNETRQIGIIKSPLKYNSLETYSLVYGSTCWAVSSSIDTNIFENDDELTVGVGGPRYRIISVNSDGALLQSVDNHRPSQGDAFVNVTPGKIGNFTITALTEPSVDKYSGDLLFIDNKEAFTPSDEQTVALRTVIKF
jgi:hypothetical protein